MAALEDLVTTLTTRRTVAGWLHQWRDPEARFTPIELIARWCAEQLEPKTLREWAAELGPRARSPFDPAEAADTPPVNMLQANLIAEISANDRAIMAEHFLKLVYEHVNIQSLHQAAADRLYPRNESEVMALAAWVRGEGPMPAYALEERKEDGGG